MAIMTVEWDSHDYSRQSSLQKTLAGENLARLEFCGTERILDVGCGDGKTTAAIARRVPQGSVLGVDPSSDMIAFAGKNFSDPNLRFEIGDARRLPYRDDFDLVVSFYALHWVPEQDAALRSIRSALKTGGRTLLQFVADGERPSIEDVIEETRKLPRWAGYFAGFSKPYAHFSAAQYRALAESAGLLVERIEVEDRDWDFGSREAFADFCRATFVAWARLLPDEERMAFINDALDRYLAAIAASPRDAGVFRFYQMVAMLARA